MLKGSFHGLCFDWTHADIFDLAILNQLAILSVLELNDLMNVLGWRSRSIASIAFVLLLLPAHIVARRA